MSIFTIIAKIITLIPSAAEAGRAIAKAFEPKQTIDVNDLTLWHTCTFGRGLMRCVTCGEYVERQNVPCPEELRRRRLYSDL